MNSALDIFPLTCWRVQQGSWSVARSGVLAGWSEESYRPEKWIWELFVPRLDSEAGETNDPVESIQRERDATGAPTFGGRERQSDFQVAGKQDIHVLNAPGKSSLETSGVRGPTSPKKLRLRCGRGLTESTSLWSQEPRAYKKG